MVTGLCDMDVMLNAWFCSDLKPGYVLYNIDVMVYVHYG